MTLKRFSLACLFVLGAVAPGRAALPADGLVGRWRFDAARDHRVADLSASNNPLVVDGELAPPKDGAPASLACDGFEVAGRVEERLPLAFKSGITLAVWVWPERSGSFDPLMGRPNPNPSWTTPLTGLYLADAHPVFGVSAPKKVLVEGPALPLRTWSLVVVTADRRAVTIWINGAKAAEEDQPLTFPAPGGQPWYLGRAATQFFRGRIGETLIWNRALTADEVSAVHAETAAAYPRETASSASAAAGWGDTYVDVETHGTSPKVGTWRKQPTRTLAGLKGFTPAAAVATDRWGGRLDGPARTATGFFRTEQIDGRWWLITPEGHPYWNVGVNSVRPPRTMTPAQASTELRSLGFNGLGNGAAPALQAVPEPLPWCIRLNFLSSFAQQHHQTYATSGHTGFTEQCIPVFHPDFPAWAREHAKALAATADAPGVIGIFTDNELQCSADLLDRHLRLPANDPYLRYGREAALAWLAAEGRPADPGKLTLKDRYRFVAYVFGAYAHIVHDAIRAVDRNHLILGSRFNVHRSQFDNPWFWPAVGPWIDVAAVNYYVLWGPQRDEIQGWSEAMHRPVMLTEWYAKALDAPGLANTNGAGWLVRTQADRAKYYQHFVLNACETPALVGFHYFKYLDDDANSVALDAAGGANKGLYKADGAPWPELQEAAREVNRQVYPLIDFFDHRAATPAP